MEHKTQDSQRVLIIGLDGATWDILDPWISDGSLPTLARLRQNGSWGDLRSTIPPITAPAWSTFMTGKGPGKHGVFHFVPLLGEKTSEQGGPERVDARSIRSSTLWDILGHHSRKVGIINVPMTYPPRPVPGFMITGLLTPKGASNFTYPAELSRELTDYIIDLDRFSDIQPFQAARASEVTAPTLAMMKEFRDMLEIRAKTTLSLMDSNPWDVFMVVFTSTDRLGHYLWPYHRYPNSDDPPEVQELCRAVHEYYVRQDEVIGELVGRAGSDVTVIVISDHGMGPFSTHRIHLNNWLHQKGWLSVEAGGQRAFNPDGLLVRLGLPRDRFGRLIWQMPGLAKTRWVQKASRSRSMALDLNRSMAYGVPMYGSGNITGIRINLAGESKEALRQEIAEGLRTITDPETGRPVVQWIHWGEDYYHGPYAESVPDILVGADPDYEWGHQLGRYSSIITKRSVFSGEGYHRLEGVFIASGPLVVAQPEPLDNLNLADIAPTVLYLTGLPVPSDMDGRVLTEIFSRGTVESRPVRVGEPLGYWPDASRALYDEETISEEDEEQILARLRALGYLG